MGVIKCRGLIINESPAGEADKALTIFTKELGKIRVYAKGARKLKSRYFAATSKFYYCDFVLFSGGDFYSLTQVDKIELFRNIPVDFNRICYGNYFLEMIDKNIYGNEPNAELLWLILSALKALDRGEINIKPIARAFEIKFMQISGYTPNMACCTECGGDTGPQMYFSHEGLLCKDCAARRPVCAPIGYPAAYAINYILGSDIKNAFLFNMDDDTAYDLKKAADILLTTLDTPILSKQMVEDIESGRL